MKKLALLLFVLPGLAYAQITQFLPRQEYTTRLQQDGGTPIWYVDVRGNDANACTSDFASRGDAGPCATPQGALQRVPKGLRHLATVSIDAGTYPGFLVSGFYADPGFQQTNGGLLIVGAIKTSDDLASGTATGTATSGTAGSTSTFGTLVNSGASWTIHDLKGRFITTASPTNTEVVIDDNTATAITVVGTWSSPTGSTTYTIQDPAATINTTAPLAAIPLSALSANVSGIGIYGNNITYRLDAFVIQNLRIAGSSNQGLNIADLSGLRLHNLQIRITGVGGPIGVDVINGTLSPMRINITNSDISVNATSASGVNSNQASTRVINTLIRNGTNSGAAVSVGSSSGSPPASLAVSGCDLTGFNKGIEGFSLAGASISASRITCGDSTGIGLKCGTVGQVGNMCSLSSIQTTNIATCGTGLQLIGPATADVTSMSGSVGTTGFDVTVGALMSYAKAGMTITAGTNEVNIDSGDTVGTFAAGTAGSCRGTTTKGTSSKVCAR